ncbi:MAG: hypothetical protein GF311_01310 [Candidatus Lokiarchaeota archaeon]|nr:hypothetical protein [Candidatus Lokiarchaeota archaeon]
MDISSFLKSLMTEYTDFGITEQVKKRFQELIISWAEKYLRNYPWRENRTPYRVLISEILLTRTKADQVVPVYEKFVDIYPTIEEFLNVKKSKLKSLIKSLGLLFRADMLKEISVRLRNEFEGKIPDEIKDLKSLRGIGNYGANAILCFGFNKRRALLDSNFIRVFKRVFRITAKTKTAKSDKFLWNFSEWLLPEKDFSNFNYGIIDLGGLICTSIKPLHKRCPLRDICQHYEGLDT